MSPGEVVPPPEILSRETVERVCLGAGPDGIASFTDVLVSHEALRLRVEELTTALVALRKASLVGNMRELEKALVDAQDALAAWRDSDGNPWFYTRDQLEQVGWELEDGVLWTMTEMGDWEAAVYDPGYESDPIVRVAVYRLRENPPSSEETR